MTWHVKQTELLKIYISLVTPPPHKSSGSATVSCLVFQISPTLTQRVKKILNVLFPLMATQVRTGLTLEREAVKMEAPWGREAELGPGKEGEKEWPWQRDMLVISYVR